MLPALFAVSAAMQIAGGVTSYLGSKKQAKAYEQQAAFQLQVGQEKAQYALDLAETEAELILQRGENEAEIAAFNAAQADQNAIFEARAGASELMDSRKRWDEQIKNLTASFASSGLLLTDTPIAVLAEQAGEAEKDAYRIQLNTENAVRKARGQADLYTLAGSRDRQMAEAQAAARRQAGQIESRTALLGAEAGAQAARIGADTARYQGLSSLLSAGGSAFSSYLQYTSKVPTKTGKDA